MLLIKLSIKNEENLTTNLFEPLIKENIKYVQFNQIKGSTKTRAKQKELVMKLKYEQNFIARFCHNCYYWRFPLGSMRNSKSILVYEFNFLNLL